MGTCRKCGKSFHACGSCGLTDRWEWEYCSDACMEARMTETIERNATKLGITPEALREAIEDFRYEEQLF